MKIETTVNGTSRSVEVLGHESAVDVIRDDFELTGTKLVCAGGVCGACTVLVDDVPSVSCLLPATSLRGAKVTTIEGIAGTGELHPVQRAFLEHDGLQCGFCTPGFIVDASSFHDRWRKAHGQQEPSRHVIAEALAGHLCRCAAYEGIYRAVAAACRGEYDDAAVPVALARVDGREKVTGSALYTTDIRLEGMLHAAILRSPIAAGEVEAIDLDSAGLAIDLLAGDRRVRWAGQPIAAVAAESLTAARDAAAAIDLNISQLPFVLDPEEAKREDAPLVYDGRKARKRAPSAAEGALTPAGWDGNVRHTGRLPFMATVAKRRVKSAREQNKPGLVEIEVETAPQLHSSFEPHAAVADWSDPERLRVWVSTQAVDHVAHELAEHFDLEDHQVDVNAEYVGGGFGSKLTLSVETIAAVELSRLARRPVRLVLDRHEELTGTGNRPGSRTKVSLLVEPDGDGHGDADVQALVVDTENHAGVAIGNQVASLAMFMYERSPRIAHDDDVVTNAPPGSPFRGPGGPTIAWAVEQAVDTAAHDLGLDPIALRLTMDGNERRQALYEWALGLDTWKRRQTADSQTGRYRQGVGFAAANWMYFVDPDTEVVVSVENGGLTVSTATQDMGTGSRTVLAQAVAEVFGLEPTDVDVRIGRSNGDTTHGPTSGGSRTTVSLWSTAQEAARELRKDIGDKVDSTNDGASATSRRGGDHGVRAVPITMGGFQVGRGFSGAVHVSHVEVDTRTGKTRVLQVHGGIAIGKAHVPLLARSQCEGSIIQGIGLALYENQILDPHTGLTLTANLEDYRIPQLGDVPEIDIHFEEQGWDHVPGGGVGLGELATISPAASIGNAVHNATGWRPTSLPIRPDRIVEALR